MYENLINEFINYENKLNNVYNRLSSKSMKNKYSMDFLGFATSMEDILFSGCTKDWDFNKIVNDYYISKRNFVNDIYDKRILFSDIAESSIEVFKKADYNFYDGYYTKFSSINKDTMLDIILSFFAEFDDEYYKVVKNSINNGELLISSIEDYSGYLLNIDSLKKNFVVVSEKADKDLLGMTSIIHEYGHYFETNLLYSNNRDNFRSKSMNTPFYEVSSSFFEYSFLRYLKENKIYNNGIDLLLHDYYNKLFMYLYNISIISKVDNIQLDSSFNMNIEGNDIFDYTKKLQEDINYYELPSVGDKIDFIDSYIYGLGSLFSIYMYDCYKGNPEYFKKEYRNTLLTYPYSNSIETFEKVGVSYDELIKGDKLEKVLRMK